MNVDQQALEQLRESLAADHYQMDFELLDGEARVRISAADDACEDCLVPKGVMRAMIAPALGIDADRVAIAYPGEPHPE